MNENTLILTEHRLVPRLFDAALTLLAWEDFSFPLCQPVDADNQRERLPLGRDYCLL